MKKKTPDELLDEFYEREGIDSTKFVRNDNRAFEKLKQDENYKDLRLRVLRELGADI